MSAKTDNNKDSSDQSIAGIVSDGGRSWLSAKYIFIVIGCLVIVAAIIFGGLYYFHERHLHQQAAANNRKIVSNEASYATDSQTLIAASTAIINQKNASATPAELAKAYIARGDAESNAGDYKAAVNDYQASVKLVPSLADQTYYKLFYSKYQSGNRSGLIPLLRKLIAYEKTHRTDFSGSDIATYQSYISDLEAGKDLQL